MHIPSESKCNSIQSSWRCKPVRIALLTAPGGETRSCCWYTPNYKLERSDIFLVPETCRWLFDLSKWVCWQRGSKPKLLLINGAPGIGKTSLAFSSLTKLRAEATRPVLSHLFNSASGPTANAGSKLLANIIVQLYASACGTSKEAIFEAIKSEQALHSTVWECSFATLQQLVKRVLETYPSYVLVVDALDECTADHRELCQFLEELALNKGAAIMATCRGPAYFNYHDHDVVELQSRTEEIGADLARFVEYEVDKKLELKADALAELRNHVINEVIARSQNNFLHAKLLVGFLEQQSTPRQTRETIDSIRYDYCSDLYEKHLNASNERLSNYPSKMVRRQCIFQMLVAAQETLSVDQISEFLAFNDETGDQDEQDLSYNITKEIKELCEPFVCFLGSRKVAFFHTSAKEFFACRSPTTLDESNLYLARKCLSTLSQDQYRKPEAVTKLLRRHLGAESTKSDTLEKPSMSSIYEYAALYFHQHVTAVQDPPSELVLKLNRFLMGVEFVMWSETIFDLKPGTSYAGQITVRVALSKWTENLSPPNQQDIQLDHYFEKAHILVYMILRDTNDDKILQFLPRIRLGDYYNSTGRELDDWEKGHDEKQIVVDGLSSVLPENDPFLLRQKVNLVLDYLWQKRYSELLPQVKALYDLQMKVAPKEDTYLTAWLFGASLIGLGLYNEAESIIVETLERVREFYGEEYRFFNILLLLEGQRLERVQDLQKAAASYRAALKTVTRTAGPQNILVLVLKTALGSVLRKQGAYDLAEPNLFEGWAGRQIVSSIDLSVCLDAALQLAMLYRDRGDSSECLKLLDTVHRSKVFAQDFERYCQLIHIRNLVAFDNGDYLIAKYSLLELLQSASGENRSKNNLELLWVRIDLADAMRQQNEHDEALMLFTDLVEAIDTTDIDSEPEPPSQLAVAERALRLVRKAEFEKSKNLLEKNNLRWVREADFWFSLTGGPTLDTSMIRPVKF